ncbi:MAG: hypothetical protein IT395_05750 [Candidatus Omnitrophica bacterium]|nr:hypothetical protein [Candidatus Omnitrophota bacterium]
MTLKETCRLIHSDYDRLLKHYHLHHSFKNVVNVFLTNSFMAVFYYRWAHYFYVKRWRMIARLIFLFNLMVTGAELLPQTRAGDGLLIIHTVATGFDCVLGKNVTIFGRTCIGSNPNDPRDIGAGPGLPLIGDNVQFGLGCHVLGPVTIGDGAMIGPGAVVMKDVPPGASVITIPPRIFTNKTGAE